MCGIAGAFIYDERGRDLRLLQGVVDKCRQRGLDAYGLLRWSPMESWKEFRHNNEITAGDMDEVYSPPVSFPTIFLHTSRAEPTTEWRDKKTVADIPPFRDGAFAVAHNGIISNDHLLETRHALGRCSPIDTSVLPPLFSKVGLGPALRELQGGAALGVVDATHPALHVYRNFMPASILWRPGICVFASEAAFFPGHGLPLPDYVSWTLPAYSGVTFSMRGYSGPFKWEAAQSAGEITAWNPYPSLGGTIQ